MQTLTYKPLNELRRFYNFMYSRWKEKIRVYVTPANNDMKLLQI